MQSVLCFSLIAILLVGNVITPLSISSSYFRTVYAEIPSDPATTPPVDNSTATTAPVDPTATAPVDPTATAPVDNSTSTTLEQIPLEIQEQPPEPLQTLSNETSQELEEQGYAVQDGNLTRELTSFSLSAWVKPDYSTGSPEFTVLSKENAFVLAINNNISPYKVAKFSLFDGINWHTVESASEIKEEWTHLAATFDDSSISIYVNGNLENTLPIESALTILVDGKFEAVSVDSISSDSDIVIGAYINANNGYETSNQFSGLIDSANIYDLLLSQSQIGELYNTSPHSADHVKPTVITDKEEYVPKESVRITGAGLAPNRSYDVVVIRSDGWILKNDRTDGFDSVYTDSTGSFVYHYNLESIAGDYLVRVYNSDSEHSSVLASAVFTDVAPTLITDKADYLPYEPVQISGAGFKAGTSYDIVVTKPDGSIIKGDGSLTLGFDRVIAGEDGNIIYSYKLENMSGLYRVKSFESTDTVHQTILALTSFADPPATAGPLFAGNAVNYGMGWAYPSNAKGSIDANCAIASGKNDNGKIIVLNNFGFGIPVNANILGITAKIDYGDDSDVQSQAIYLIKNGVTAGINKNFGRTSSNAHDCKTSDFVTLPPVARNDLWGTSWTPADIHSANFGLEIVAGSSSSTRYLDRAQIMITYNNPPVANNDSATTNEDTTINVNVLTNDVDVDSDPLSVVSVTQGTHGSVLLNAGNTIGYTPLPNFNGKDSFTYTISDGNGGLATATVNVSVTPVNDAPVASDDTGTTN